MLTELYRNLIRSNREYKKLPTLQKDSNIRAISNKLDVVLKKLTTHTPNGPPEPPRTTPTYASVAKNAVPTIRVRMDETLKGNATTNQELYRKLEGTIHGMVAARQIRSGDVEITLQSQSDKEKIMAQDDNRDGLRVLRQDYLVTVPGVSYDTHIGEGKDANAINAELIRTLEGENKR
jgi:hypothetical protein